MNDQFKVGTICIGQNFVRDLIRNDMECEVIGGLKMRRYWDLHTGEISVSLCYRVRWADGAELCHYPINLRLPPPKHKEWADEAIRKLKKQSSDHVAVQLADAIPEEKTCALSS